MNPSRTLLAADFSGDALRSTGDSSRPRSSYQAVAEHLLGELGLTELRHRRSARLTAEDHRVDLARMASSGERVIASVSQLR